MKFKDLSSTQFLEVRPLFCSRSWKLDQSQTSPKETGLKLANISSCLGKNTHQIAFYYYRERMYPLKNILVALLLFNLNFSEANETECRNSIISRLQEVVESSMENVLQTIAWKRVHWRSKYETHFRTKFPRHYVALCRIVNLYC